MTVEELLKPRIIVENLYPNCPFQPLEIICNPSAQQTEWANKYPYIFRWLNWWEERDEKDMPEYIKWESCNSGRLYVVKVLNLNATSFKWEDGWGEFTKDQDFPATKEEYEQSK